MIVQLPYANRIGLFAAHYWFVLWAADGCHRGEVWQTKNAGGQSFGHVHCDLRPPDAGVGGGPARIAAEWTGAEAGAIKAVLDDVSDYRHRERYLAWLGPNSNTFASLGPAPHGNPLSPGLDEPWETLAGGVTPSSTGERVVDVPARNSGHPRTSPNGQHQKYAGRNSYVANGRSQGTADLRRRRTRCDESSEEDQQRSWPPAAGSRRLGARTSAT